MKKKLLDWIHSYLKSKEVVLRITKYCNQSCIFCLTDIDNSTHISYEDILLEIDSIADKYKGDDLNFVITWGEPELHPDFFKIIDYLYNKNYYITIQTNAVILWNWDKFKQLEKYIDKLSFFISFHSSIESIYDIITWSKWQFSLAVKWIKNILNNGNFIDLNINIVLNSFNIKFLKHYFSFIWKEFSSINNNFAINISLMTNIYKYNYAKKILVNYSDVVKWINDIEKIIQNYNIKIWNNFWWACDLPFCIAKKLFFYEEKLSNEYREIIDRVKLDSCKDCKYDKNCNGILKLYIEKFWDSEFIPIK
jgi:MoaA/NifB/PqqE/SkfB family radical SAM enzyme